MKYSEAKKELEELGYIFDRDTYYGEILVRSKEGKILIAIPDDGGIIMDADYEYFANLSKQEQKELIFIMTEVMLTPPEEREEEKRYRLRANLPQVKTNNFLCLYSHDVWILSIGQDANYKKSVFTESELEHIDETGFIREEVTE